MVIASFFWYTITKGRGLFMKLVFSGAAHEVTGSKHYLEAAGKHILIDCGKEQGKD